MKFKLHIGLFFLTVLLLGVSCSNLDNPVGKSLDLDLKSETKWIIDKNTEEKISKIYYKEYDILGNIILNEDYFENGNLNCKSVFEYSGQDSSTEEKLVFDESGNIVNEVTTDYIYNEFGNIAKSIKYNTDGEVTNIYVYEYDQQGNLLKKTSALSSDSLLNIEYSYRYNQHGNVVERVVNDIANPAQRVRDSVIYSSANEINIYKYEGNKLSFVTSYLYNKSGMIYKEIVSNSKGEIIQKYLYEYSYY